MKKELIENFLKGVSQGAIEELAHYSANFQALQLCASNPQSDLHEMNFSDTTPYHLIETLIELSSGRWAGRKEAKNMARDFPSLWAVCETAEAQELGATLVYNEMRYGLGVEKLAEEYAEAMYEEAFGGSGNKVC